MSDAKKVEAIGAATAPRVAERVTTESRTREAREEREPDPPPPPIEPSPAFRPYRVQLDPQTSRIFTEVIDQQTGQVLLRIPPGYAPPPELEAQEPQPRKEIEL